MPINTPLIAKRIGLKGQKERKRKEIISGLQLIMNGTDHMVKKFCLLFVLFLAACSGYSEDHYVTITQGYYTSCQGHIRQYQDFPQGRQALIQLSSCWDYYAVGQSYWFSQWQYQQN